MFIMHWVNAVQHFCTDVTFAQQEPSIASNTFTVVVPRKMGQQAIQRRKRNKIACEIQSKPFFAFLTGDHIAAVSIPASAVNEESTCVLSRMKSLRYVVVIGDTPQFDAIAQLQKALATTQVVDDEEFLDEQIYTSKARSTKPSEGLLVK